MNSFLELATKRRSIRKFQDKDVPDEDVKYFIDAAVRAPSGCNSQCWKFVAIKNKEIIRKIENAVIEELEKILEVKKSELSEDYLNSKRKAVSFFAKAPLVIAVFMTKAEFYDKTMVLALKEQGLDDEDIMELFANYDLLSIGAAVENLLLAVQEKGYGACWMNEPAIAAERIKEILEMDEDDRFISLIPVGVPAYTPRDKRMKELSEVFKMI
ncbi:MAG TPA: nitroreductase [Hungateiclostridium thermocellum]|uniref:Nitroreductase n=2 Tax=Acetivibrio thermocellus TaxID=1515 RepID=A3DJV4_ACET2|nr:nitroreductase family protein [Acetivibrio thermocellus]CDG37523.1 nitroreductase [Acetivibrio thermocellus BC1]ABN54233.1 nitroreductase [Acetivibrio thermocellus ATCC 27405]ADU73670.1 nitroreductase [Acetivibrio thermocellus DSM 1313]ALX07599.1 nitroreductase [Acetivibrio thermocellus AD2]ANV75339.1 nitroreductase [Acetivibrio thermocellus DSM 2360]